MSGRSPPLYCTLTLIAMQGHQKNSKNKNNLVHLSSNTVVVIYCCIGYKDKAVPFESITVSSACELISLSIRYPQVVVVFVFFLGSFLCVVWLSSVARSCATQDESNKDNVWTPTI